MDQQHLFEPIPEDKMGLLTKEELIILIRGERSLRQQLQRDNERLRALNEELKQKKFLIDDQYIVLKNKYFGKSSERSLDQDNEDASSKASKTSKKRVQLPSQRYPNAPLIEREVELETLPSCSCCGHEMHDSGMTENSEFLTVVPKQYIVIRQKRHKYSCGKCHGDIKTAPPPPRMKPGSAYSDEMAVDVAASKFCDLIPIERYATMAGREGLKDLPPQSLIEATHNLADFVKPAYQKIESEILASQVIHCRISSVLCHPIS
jgi:transposase